MVFSTALVHKVVFTATAFFLRCLRTAAGTPCRISSVLTQLMDSVRSDLLLKQVIVFSMVQRGVAVASEVERSSDSPKRAAPFQCCIILRPTGVWALSRSVE